MEIGVAESGSRRLAAEDVKALRVYLRAQVNQAGTRKTLDARSRARIEMHVALDDAAERIGSILAQLVQSRAVSDDESQAWLNAAGLAAPIRTKSQVAATLGLKSAKALDGRLAKIDRMLVLPLSSFAPSPLAQPSVDPLNLLLRAVELDELGDSDSADGYVQAAADVAGAKVVSFLGEDRSRRSRARHQSIELHRRGALFTSSAPTIRSSHDVVAVRCTLESDPAAAVVELRRAWLQNEFDAYPILIGHALRLVPDFSAAGIETRLSLLEVVANLYRDAEALSAIAWAQRWGIEVARAYPKHMDIRRIKAKRTVAHGLQVHGFWRSAIGLLESCEYALLREFRNHPEFALELGDIRHRLLSAWLAAGESSDAKIVKLRLAMNEDTPGPVGVVRDALHVRSIDVQANRRSGARARGQSYEAALGAAFDELATAAGARYFGLADAILHASHRVGDAATIMHLVENYSILAPAQWANLAYRIERRITTVQSKVRGLAAPVELGLATPLHPLRAGERVAADLRAAI